MISVEILAILSQAGSGMGDALSGLNIPGVALLGTTGIGAVLAIVRWMVKYQQEFTNFYIEENEKLRLRITKLEDERSAKEIEAVKATRDMLAYERESERRISTLESQIAQQERTISAQDRKIERLQKEVRRLEGNE